MSILPDPALTPPPVPDAVPHPTWCDPRRCHVYLRGDGLEPLLVHEGEHQKLLYRSVVLFQCEVLSEDLTRVVRTCSPW